MSQDVAQCIPEPWYHWHRFATLPHLRIKQPDEWNTWGFHFHWLVFRAWTMDSVQLQVEASLDDQQIVLRAMVPYLIFGIFVPVFPRRLSHKLWRKTRAYKNLMKTDAERESQQISERGEK